MMRVRCPHWWPSLVALFAAFSIAGCANAPLSLPEDDGVAKNLAAIQERPTSTQLDWRQPKELVGGAYDEIEPRPIAGFPAPGALREALSYSRKHAGLGLMIWHDADLVAADFSDGVTAQTRFGSYSMHKSVLAIAVLAAVEDGYISSLDDRVGRYIKAWRKDPRGDITLRQLLTHSSGLKHYPYSSPEAMAINLSNRIREAALAFPLDKEPGTYFQYSNINSLIIGITLETALRKQKLRYSEYLSQRIWQPLGNHDAALWVDREGGVPRYPSGLEAGLGDWLNLGVMLANDGKFNGKTILTSESVAMLTTPSAINPAYGLHIWLGDSWQPQRGYGPGTAAKVIHSAPYLVPDVWFFDGFGGQRVYVVPSAKLAVARFGEIDMAYDDAYIINTLLRGLIDEKSERSRQSYKSQQADAVYMARFDALMKQTESGAGLDGYDPLVPLPGAPGHQPLPVRTDAWLDQVTREQLSTIAETTNTEALQVWYRGAVVFSSFEERTDANTPVISRSLSKPLSVVAIGRAIERGFIRSLDQPAADFLTEWQNTPKSDITIRHLLQMRSGLAPQGFSLNPNDVMSRAYLHPFHAEVIINEYPLVNPPGSRYDYSNANAELIAPIIERATGRSYEQWISQEVLLPLGARGGQIWVNRLGGTAHSGCCALLPSETWLRLSVLLLNDGDWNERTLLPPGFVTEMTTPTPYYPYAAMGLYVAGDYIEYRGHANPDVPYRKVFHSEPYLADDLFLFDGNGNQVSYIIPSHDLIILRVGVTPPKDVTWDNARLPNLLLRALARNSAVRLTPQPD